jgi:hypothetical protein
MNALIDELRKETFPIIFTNKDLDTINFDKFELKEMLEEALMNKWVHNIYKDIYTLARMYRRSLLSGGVLAQMIEPDSYVSTYYVLGNAGWIPEAVHNVSSITNKAFMRVETDRFGSYRYDKIYDVAPAAGIYIEEDDNGKYKSATPLRAVCDYIYMFDKNWDSAEDLIINLRIHDDDLEELKKEDFEEMHDQFGIKNIENFLIGLRKDLYL